MLTWVIESSNQQTNEPLQQSITGTLPHIFAYRINNINYILHIALLLNKTKQSAGYT